MRISQLLMAVLFGFFLVFTGCGGGGGGGSVTGNGTVIDSAGGVIEFTDPSSPLFGLIVDIPQGALSSPETIVIDVTNKTIPLPSGINTSEIILRLSPEGLSFDDYITITIPYEGTEVPTIISYEESTDTYDVLPIVNVDEQNKTVMVKTNHFSLIGKVSTLITERLDTDFNISSDAFSINNTAYYFGQGACWGFSSYSKWYFDNKKNTDGNLWDRYGNCEVNLITDAQSTRWTELIDTILNVPGALIPSLTLAEINSAILISGDPQILGLANSDFSKVHAVLVYSILPTSTGFIYYIYDNVDNENEYEIIYNSDNLSFEEYDNGYNTYTRFFYLGSADSFAMQEIFYRYNNCPIDDNDQPSTPTGLTVNANSSDWIFLEWTPSTDNIGVVGYKVYRDGVYLKSVTAAGASDYDLNPSTNYCYTVSAYDAAGNESGQSTQSCGTTESFVFPNIGQEENVVSSGIIPRWSPTTEKIAFIGKQLDTSHNGIWIYDGLNDTSIELYATGLYPEWSPSGDKICFYNDGNLFVMNADGTGVVDTGLQVGRDIQWSPDGKYILAGLGLGSPSSALVLIDAISWTSQNIYFANHNGEVGDFSWTPSGEILVTIARPQYADDDWATNELKIFDLNGTLIRSLFIDGYTTRPFSPSISPNGKYLVFSVGSRGLWLASSDGSNASQISERGGYVSWSADSNYLVFDDSSGTTSTENGIFVMEITTVE